MGGDIMPKAVLNVKLIDASKDALSIIYAACRQCYSQKFAADIFDENIPEQKKQEFVKKVSASGHESPLEHVKFTFAIEGVSRALTHQLVRYRIASYSQQSQRYVQEADFEYVVPPSIASDEAMHKEYLCVLDKVKDSYNNLIKMFNEKGIEGEKANQDARFVLPQASETKIVVTMNARELIYFFKERCCIRAQWEIRALAQKMLEIVKEQLPAVFSETAGAKCEALRLCPEDKQFSCGKYPAEDKIK